MTKVSDSQRKQIEDALKDPAGTPLPEGVRINFGEPEPFQKNDEAASKPNEKLG